MNRRRALGAFLLLGLSLTAFAQSDAELAAWIATNRTKREVMIPMRDGVKLFTAIYAPKEPNGPAPIMLLRTPYSCSPYGETEFRNLLGPSEHFSRAEYIIVYQDVRGCYMSEGTFINVRPMRDKERPEEEPIDESTDTFDTIDWLVKNVPDNNGRVGMWGISYPGFYAAAGMIDAHPALVCSSPQAPVADWFFDDFRHHGTFFLAHSFNFLAAFGRARPEPTSRRGDRFAHGTPDGYAFFLDMGPLANADSRWFKGSIAYWNELLAHPNYDEYWQRRSLPPRLRSVAPNVLTVGGWFDAEDLYGPLAVYRAIERQNPDITNGLVMGPWVHGGWARNDGDRLGDIDFGSKTAREYRADIEFPFFEKHLRGVEVEGPVEATVYDTGSLAWKRFGTWPPSNTKARMLWFEDRQGLSFAEPGAAEGVDEFISDPARPVPYTETIATGMTKEYMTEDQRFASRRPDVLVYQTGVLTEDLTVAGPLTAELWVSTSAKDADWIVKLIDVFPPDATRPDGDQRRPLGGYQMMVRSEAFRGRFRNSYSEPEPFVSDEPARVAVPLQDVMHTFKKGHRLMVQVQSSWFPLVDRNPQAWVPNVADAQPDDFIKATHRVYRSKSRPSALRFGALE